MRTPRIFHLNFCLIPVAFVLACSPAWAALTASPNAVAFQIAGSSSQIVTQDVQITGGSTSLTGVTCTNSPAVTIGGANYPVFTGSVASATLVSLRVNSVLVGSSYLTGTYTGTCTVTDSANATVAISMSLTVGGSIAFNVSPTTWSPSVPVGGSIPALTVNISSGNLSMGFTVTKNRDWLTVGTTSGTTSPNLNTAILVGVSSAGLTAGTYSGAVTVTPNTGTPVNVSVTLTVGGTGGSLSLSPTSMTFAGTTGGANPADQPLYIQTGVGATSYYVYSNSTWVSPTTSFGYFTGGAASLFVSVNPTAAGVVNGANIGTITVQDNLGNFQTLNVTLNMNTSGGTGTVYASPSSLSFMYPGGVTQQAFTVYGAGENFTVTAYGAWMTAAKTGSTVYVTANPANLMANTYTGSIYISTTAMTPQVTFPVQVTFQVGQGSGYSGTVAGPGTLNFAMQQGGSPPPYQTIVVAGATNSSYTATSVTNDGAPWLTLGNNSGTTPGTVTANISAAASSLAAGTYYGSISVTSSYGTLVIQVSLLVGTAGTPVIQIGPGTIALNYQSGTAAPAPQYIQIATSPAASLTFSAVSTVSWLQVFTPTSSVTPATIAIQPTVSGLSPGINTGAITVTASGAANATVSVPVVINVYGTAAVTVNPSALTFATAAGTSPNSQTLALSTSAPASFTAAANSTGWLSVTPTSGTTPANLTVAVNGAGLTAGSYTGSISITANGQTQTVNVTLTVGAGVVGTLSASPLTLSFDYVQGDASPAAKQVSVSSSGASLTYNAAATPTDGSGWLAVTPASGSTPGTLSVSVSPSGLGTGTYRGTVAVTSAGANGSPQTVNVTLNVRPAPALVLSQNGLAFSFRTDGAVPGGQSVRVTSSGSELGFTAASNVAWMTLSPTSGTTPADLTLGVQPSGLAVGRHTGTCTITATSGRGSQTIDVVLVVSAPLPTISRLGNLYSYAEGKLAPGQAFVLFGENMGPATLAQAQPESGRFATALSDVRVRVNGVEAPLLYASAGQVAAIAPYKLAGAREANVQLEYQGSRSNSMTLAAVEAAPGIATADSSGTGQAAALNGDGGFNSASNAAARGSVVVLYVTGEGQTNPAGDDGTIAAGDVRSLPKPMLQVTVTIGGQTATVAYAGAAPGLPAGIMQVNVEVPATSPTGNVPVVVNVGGVSSQPGVTLAVK